MTKKSNAHTLIELIVIVVMLGALAFIAIPRLQLGTIHRKKADTVTRKIVTDLRRTRQLAISNAATNTAGFTLTMVGSSPYTSYNIVDANSGGTVDSHTIDSAVSCTGGATFQFGTLGNLKTGSDTQLAVSADGKIFTISITPATGIIKCTEN